MKPFRRSEFAPRLELLPLIDVVFLLLTFFIYAMITLFQAQVLDVDLTPVAAGETASRSPNHTITISLDGQLYFDARRMTRPEVEEQLARIGRMSPQPIVYLATQAPGIPIRMQDDDTSPGEEPAVQPTIDRWPLVQRLITAAQQAGVEQFKVVGPRPDAVNAAE